MAFVLAVSTSAAIGQTINLGTGSEISIGDLARLIARLMDKPIDIESDDLRMRPEGSEVERLLADNRLAREVLGWEPRVSLADGLLRTIEWIQQYPERYRPGVYIV